MKPREILQLAQAEGLSQAEVFYSRSTSTGFEIYEGKMESYQSAVRQGISLRAQLDGKMGYSYTELDEEEAVHQLIQQCRENAAVLDKKESVEFVSPSPISIVSSEFPEIRNHSIREKKEKILEFEQMIHDYDERITQVTCRYQEVENETAIANTQGLDLLRKSNAAVCVTSLVAKENEQSVAVYLINVITDFSKWEIKQQAIKAAKKVLAKLNPSRIPSGNYRCLIQNESFSDLFGMLCDMFSQDQALKGLSVLKDKLNQPIFSEKITIVDDPLMENGYSSCGFDDEGNACFIKKVVEQGKLNLFLNDQKSATKANTSPTGNGFRGSYAGRIGVSPTNFYIEKGELSEEELIKKLDCGVLITDLAGLHAGLNPLTTNFSLEASGFWVEEGKIVRPISLFTIAANYMELMNQIIEIGNDLKFSAEGIGAPSILFESIAVSGE